MAYGEHTAELYTTANNNLATWNDQKEEEREQGTKNNKHLI
jgi:hypothetical protein